MTRSLPWQPSQPWTSSPRQHRFLILGLVRTARKVSNQTTPSDNTISITRSSPERHARSALRVCAPARLRLHGYSRRHVLITSLYRLSTCFSTDTAPAPFPVINCVDKLRFHPLLSLAEQTQRPTPTPRSPVPTTVSVLWVTVAGSGHLGATGRGLVTCGVAASRYISDLAASEHRRDRRGS